MLVLVLGVDCQGAVLGVGWLPPCGGSCGALTGGFSMRVSERLLGALLCPCLAKV